MSLALSPPLICLRSYNKPSTADVLVKFGDGTITGIFANRVILAAGSTKFALDFSPTGNVSHPYISVSVVSVLLTLMQDYMKRTVYIDSQDKIYTHQSMELLLKHLYGIDDEVGSTQNQIELYEMAKDYGVQTLIDRIALEMQQSLEANVAFPDPFFGMLQTIYEQHYKSGDPIRSTVGEVCARNFVKLMRESQFRQALMTWHELAVDVLFQLMGRVLGSLSSWSPAN